MTVSRKLPVRSFVAAFGASLLAVALVHGISLRHAFVYDDHWTIVRNAALERARPVLRFFLDRDTVADPSTGMGATIYRPLPTLTFALARAAGREGPAGYRVENLALHALNGALLYALLGALGAGPVAAGLGAAVFLLHPAQVETVVWVTQRSNPLCVAGLLLALLGLWAGSPLAAAGLALALLSKETAAAAALTFPLFLRAYRPDDRFWESGRTRTILLGLGVLIAGYLLLRSEVVGSFAQREHRGGSPIGNLLIGAIAGREYLKMFFWPLDLRVSYRQPVVAPGWDATTWMGAVLAGAAVAAVVLLWRRDRRAGFWGIWILACLAPVLGLFPTDTYAAERFLYAPLLGAGALVARAWDAAAGIRIGRPLKAALAATVLAWAGISAWQTRVWRDDETLWTRAVHVDPGHGFARLCLAQALHEKGDGPGAQAGYEEALRSGLTQGHAATALTNLAELRLTAGDPVGARDWAKKALRADPDSFVAFRIQIRALVALNDRAAALNAVDEWAARHPGPAWEPLRRALRAPRGEKS